ncbi:Tetratricopeptide repeat-containing protein [Chryseobacterium polytrichastri]|uniref:Tetratricopeptide repeat-containing protein n=1 Tax=Chryseobacterium polytrichastri TaxID=1302687 RepID=A0A1M6PIV1_9FLAO|nr:Tetratricopeptide repeat-containing protein [Chryseobacterium polytrichastri]
MFQNHLILKTYFVLFLMLSSVHYSQNYSLKKLDSINEDYRLKGKLEEAIDFSSKALDNFKKTKNTEGIVITNIYIANHLITIGKYKEGLQYLDDAKDDINNINNPLFSSRLYTEYGRYYSLINLFKQSNKNLNKAIQYLNKVKDREVKRGYLYYNYSWKWFNFEMLKKPDSAYSMRNKCLLLATNRTIVYTKIADDFITRKVYLDSAEYYLNKSLQANNKNLPYEKSRTLEIFGNLYKTKGEYNKALDYYIQSLEISQKIKRKFDIRSGYKNISDTYKLLGNTEESQKYFLKFTVLNDSINFNEQKVMGKTIERLLQEKEQEERNKFYLLGGVIFIIFLGLVYFIRKKNIKNQKKKDKLIETQSLETEQLKKKVSHSFDEITELAKNGDPFFMIKFKELFHDFYEKLIIQSPDLTEHDVRSCAYIKLELNNKDISRLENVTVRAIQTKRYRLKKKLNLPADVDLVKWIIEL